MVIRTFLLAVIDLLANILFRVRRIFAFNIEEFPNKDLITDSFFPYDLVIPIKCVDNPEYNVIDKSHYNIGIVVGFSTTGSQGTGKIKVAHFNLAEVNVPYVTYYDKEELALLSGPLESMKYLNEFLKMEALNESKESDDEGNEGEGGGGGNFTVH